MMDLKQIIREPVIIDENSTLRQALELTYDPPFSLLIVQNKHNKLVGILSEGDMRRLILRGYSLDRSIKDFVQRNPILIHQKDIGNEKVINNIIFQIKNKIGNEIYKQAVIPVVEADNKVIGLISAVGLERLQNGDVPHSSVLNGNSQRQILVVGGAGYIGSVLSTMLVEYGYKTRVLDKMIYSKTSLDHLSKENFDLQTGDAKNIDTIVGALEDIDAVVYLAEIVGDQACRILPRTAIKTNYLSLASIAHLCSYLHIKYFIYTSSCSVYGASQNGVTILTEDSPTNPLSLYARIKLLSEESILSMPSFSFSPTILRLATVFGYSYRPRFDLVVNTFAAKAFFDNVYVRDIAKAIIKILESPLEKVGNQIFNVGNAQNNHTILELAELTREVFGTTKIEVLNEVSDSRNYKIDSSKLKETINFGEYTSVKKGLLEIKAKLEENAIVDYCHASYSNFAIANNLCVDDEKGS